MTEVPIVIDNGSSTLKAGFAANKHPSVVLPTLPWDLADSTKSESRFVGYGALTHRSILPISSPIRDGEVVNWEDMEHAWRQVYSHYLAICPTDAPLLITEPLYSTRLSRRHLLEVVFEALTVPAFYAVSSPVLALFSTKITTGLVVDSGEIRTSIVPIIDGQVVRQAIVTSPFAGLSVTEKLNQLLAQKGAAGLDVVRDIKERFCYISLIDTEEDIEKAKKRYYELPDGKMITLGSELYQCTEEIFSPSPSYNHCNGLPSLVRQAAFETTGLTNARLMLENIVLSGASTLYPGYIQRLGRALRSITPTNITPSINIFAEVDRQFAAWRGGSVLASFDNFRPFWITNREYADQGADRLDDYFH